MNEDEETPADDPLARAQAQADAARSAVVSAEERVKSLGDKLNPMSPSFIYGVVQTGDAVGEEIRTREELRQAEGELQAARDNLVQANQAVETARDAARHFADWSLDTRGGRRVSPLASVSGGRRSARGVAPVKEVQ